MKGTDPYVTCGMGRRMYHKMLFYDFYFMCDGPVRRKVESHPWLYVLGFVCRLGICAQLDCLDTVSILSDQQTGDIFDKGLKQ